MVDYNLYEVYFSGIYCNGKRPDCNTLSGLFYASLSFLERMVGCLAGTIYEMPLMVGNRNVTVFLQDGFFNTVENKVSHHSHSNTELHMIVRGRTEYMAEGERLRIGRGQLAVIPAGVFHGGWDPEPNTRRLAFQINLPVSRLQVMPVPEEEIDGLHSAISEFKETGNAVRMGLYLALICSHVCEEAEITPEPVTDRGFLISEFFCNNYAQDISLEDLAAVLKVSQRQASRLVQKHTGHSFQEELATHRIHAARRLMRESEMSMECIAEAVGYKSYSGFWKIMKKV